MRYKAKYARYAAIILALLFLFAACTHGGSAQDDAAPREEPAPEEQTAHISIECNNAAEAGISGAPENGWILEEEKVELIEGDTVWDILSRVCRQKGIAVAKKGSGNALLVTGINGVTSVNAKSGWMYSVNGFFVMASAGSCKVDAGDTIAWRYTMDNGKDL